MHQDSLTSNSLGIPPIQIRRETLSRIKYLLVPLCFGSSCKRLPRCITNFGSGALGRSLEYSV